MNSIETKQIHQDASNDTLGVQKEHDHNIDSAMQGVGLPAHASTTKNDAFNYSFVSTIARIAIYDDLRSAPRVIEIEPAETTRFIENLASSIYEQAKGMGGSIPYTVIREVAENFIHAQFSEIVISILDQGKTIRFSDQGPGIKQKDKAQLPGFTSATEAMKRYIRGVGSGLPIVKDYLSFSNGSITIEDNLEQGAVITVSMAAQPAAPPAQQQVLQAQDHFLASIVLHLTAREKTFLSLMLHEGALGVTDLVNLTNTAASSTYAALKKLEEYGLVEKTNGQKRILTDYGFTVAQSLSA